MQNAAEHQAVQRQLQELQKEAEQSLQASPASTKPPPGQSGAGTGASQRTAQADGQVKAGGGAPAPVPAPPVVDASQQKAAVVAQQHAAEAARQQALQAQQAARDAAAQEAAGKAAAQQAATQQAELLQQREALEKQLDQLRAQMAAVSHDVASLHVQADAERHAVDALQQKQAAEQTRLDQLETQREAAAAAAHAAMVRQAKAKERAAHMTALAQGNASPPAAPTPVPAPAASPEAANPGAASRPHPVRHSRVTGGDTGAVEAVLDRLRRQARLSRASGRDAEQANAGAAQVHPPVQDADSTPVGSGNGPAYQPPPQVGPRQHLGMARAALVAGDLDRARQYLEEAQLQLVFRPVTPTADEPSQAGQAAGDVAEALSMLGAGDAGTALQYVDRALGDTGQGRAQAPPPQAYGYAPPGTGYAGPAQTAYGQ